MAFVSFRGATAKDKEQLLGREFANIEVLEADLGASPPVVRILLEGKPVTLVGDPVGALRTYLGGTPEEGYAAPN